MKHKKVNTFNKSKIVEGPSKKSTVSFPFIPDELKLLDCDCTASKESISKLESLFVRGRHFKIISIETLQHDSPFNK